MEWNVAKINIFGWFFTIFWYWYEQIVKSVQVIIPTMLHLIKHIFMFITKEKSGLLDLFGASLLMFVENGNIFLFSKDFFSLIQFFPMIASFAVTTTYIFGVVTKFPLKWGMLCFVLPWGGVSSQNWPVAAATIKCYDVVVLWGW